MVYSVTESGHEKTPEGEHPVMQKLEKSYRQRISPMTSWTVHP